jgi:hypothetical protein
VAEEPTGFLGRWSRRKADVLQGKAVSEPVVLAKPVLPESVENEARPVQEQAIEKPPALSLDDVKLLTKDSDFKPFMAQNVSADVRNAAMKKLFADPHFNIMDGLDIYIDDYSKSDPIPDAMLRAMTSSKFLKLFDEEEELEKKDPVNKDDAFPSRENANKLADQTVAQSDQATEIAEHASVPQIHSSQSVSMPQGIDPMASHKDHDNPHLRLQPDHAAPSPKAGRGT